MIIDEEDLIIIRHKLKLLKKVSAPHKFFIINIIYARHLLISLRHDGFILLYIIFNITHIIYLIFNISHYSHTQTF